MNIGEFRDAILSFRVTGRRSGLLENTSSNVSWTDGRWSSAGFSSPRKSDPTPIAHSERLFSTFMDHLPAYAWIKDLDGGYVYVNQRVRQLLPYQYDYIGKTDKDFWPLERAAAYRESDLKVIETGEEVETVDWFTLNGKQSYVLVTKFPILDASGAVIMVGGTSVDITEHKRVEEALRQSESFRRMIIESEPECVKLVAPDYTLLDMNPAGLRMIGATSREQVVGQSVLDLVAAESRSTFIGMHQRVCQGESVVKEFEIVGLNGARRWMESHAAPLLDKESRVMALLAVTRDVTERKSAEEALRHAEQKYRRIFENATEGIFQSTPDGKLIDANPALAFMYGFDSPEEMVRDCNDIAQLYVDPSRHEEFRKLIETHGVIRDFEYQAFQKDGKKIWISSNARAVRDDKGSCSYYEGTAHDITDRKQTENDLIKQKEMLQTIVDHIPVMINFSDSDGRPILVNQEWQHTLGWSLDEIQTNDIDVYAECYPDPEYLQQVRSFVASATEDWGDFRTRIRDGSVIDTSWARVKLSDGTTLGIGQDVTARKSAEQALRKAEQKYRELFENAKDATYVHDFSGKYTSINRAAEKLTGYSREEILGNDFTSFVAPEYQEQMRENLCHKLRQEGETTYEVEVVTKDGHRVPVEVSSRLIYEEGVPVAVQGTARNIVERKRAEEALRGFSRQLIRAQEAERQSIARELHDQIGQLMTAIRINLETILNSSTREESNALIDEGITLVDEAIHQVRNLSFELRPSLLDDLGLTAALHWYADRYAQRTGIQTTTSICPESQIRLPRELETSCFRIVQEALTNVARHAQAKNVSIDVKTVNGDLALSVKDDGLGFNSRALSDSVPLNSLGLRGMEERVRGLGGHLEIKSSPREGTEVSVYFPNGNKRSESN
jgi:PAS domain S-box-containing protein